jgi:L-lysine 2,3-aminomutase
MSVGVENVKAQKKWRDKNREHVREKQRERRQAVKQWFYEEVVSKQSCTECGENHPAVLDFHHLDPEEKENSICDMVCKRFSKKKILAEVSKCIVLCSNCHRKHHWQERIVKQPWAIGEGVLTSVL